MKGAWIRQQRKYKGLTLKELAEGICSISYLSKIEHGKVEASEELYMKLGKKLDINLCNKNQSFDTNIYQMLIDWYDVSKNRDISLMTDYFLNCQDQIRYTYNNTLVSLFKILEARHKLITYGEMTEKKKLDELKNLASNSEDIVQFFYYKLIGTIELTYAKYTEALHSLTKVSQLMDGLSMEDSETYFHLCMVYSKLRLPVESNYYGNKAITLFERELNINRTIDTYLMIAINYRYLQAYDLAIDYYLKILKIGKNVLNKDKYRRIYHNIGYIFTNKNDYKSALPYLEMAYDIKTSDLPFLVNTIYLLASSHYHLQNTQKTNYYIAMGERLALEHDLTFYKYKFFILKGHIENEIYEDHFINTLEKEIIPYTYEIEEYERYNDFLELLGNIYFHLKKYKKSASYYRKMGELLNYKEKEDHKGVGKK